MFCEKVFPNQHLEVSNIDLALIADVRKGGNSEDLRLLFFPRMHDIRSGRLSKGRLALSADYIKERLTLPQIPGHKVGGSIYQTRRPDFLAKLYDQDYVRAFEVLKTKNDLKFPTWESWSELTLNVSDRLRKYLQQLAFWYKPAWKYPGANSIAMPAFSWPSQLCQCVHGEADPSAADIARFEDMITCLWELV
jgi:hypothetical protein